MGLKLLLADESITIRKVVLKVFSNPDYEVASVKNHDEILKAAKRLHPDIVLLSANFPEIDLTEDIAKIAKLSSQPNSIILLGDRGNGLDPEKSLELGAGGFIYKPLDNRELLKTIDSILGKTPEKSDTIQSPVEENKQNAILSTIAPVVPDTTGQDIDKRAEILFDLFESYFSENMVLLTDTMTKALIPKIAADISSRVIESLEMTELPKQIMTMTKGIVNDLVPQIAERVISREIASIKEEAIRLIEAEDDEENV
ncbi:response regulator [bacterium]|nr:response regulator [bacterium]